MKLDVWNVLPINSIEKYMLLPNNKFCKFLSLNKFEFVKNILHDKNAYFSKEDQLNDPIETINGGNLAVSLWQNIDDVETMTGITRSFCLTRPKNIGSISLMWAHYGDSFRGIRVNFELTGTPSYSSAEVNYKPIEEIAIKWNQSSNKDLAISEIVKADWWSYENEIRYLTLTWPLPEHHFVPLEKLGLTITSVNVTKSTKCHSNYTKLVKLCLEQNIPIVEWDYRNVALHAIKGDPIE